VVAPDRSVTMTNTELYLTFAAFFSVLTAVLLILAAAIVQARLQLARPRRERYRASDSTIPVDRR